MKKIKLLDCTLRDGAYIVDSMFGDSTIKGIISKLQNAGVEIIECGWLKNFEHENGSSFFHVPSDLGKYITNKSPNTTYVAMIDWDRYDLNFLPSNDNNYLDAIRVVFPKGKHKQGIEVGEEISRKGYKVFYQAANTLGYSDDELIELADDINKSNTVGLSVVDTFGAMYEEDLERILNVLDSRLNKNIKLGFHSHNNQQLSFSLTTWFLKFFKDSEREIIIDSSLCGMGRGAGNATTELVISYLNKKYDTHYNLDEIMDAIDIYMTYFQENYSWGYSTPYFISGLYCCHVNNIAYLLNNHHTSAKDMRNIIESLSPADRLKYDYDLLQQKYIENQSRYVDDKKYIEKLKKAVKNRRVLLIAPGKTSVSEMEDIKSYIYANNPIVIGVNAIIPEYEYDYLFFVNPSRYDYAQNAYPEEFNNTKHIILSNIKNSCAKNDLLINYESVIRRGWRHFDNAVMCCLYLLERLNAENIAIAGFDGFKNKYNESYADKLLPSLNLTGEWDNLNEEIRSMFIRFTETTEVCKNIEFLTDSIFCC